MAIDANTNFPPEQVEEMRKLLEVNENMKKLEKMKKTLVDNVKKYMCSINADCVDVDGDKITLTESQRRTVTKATKDEFIASLAAKGMQYLIKTEIEPDLDSIFAEVDAGKLEQSFVDKYVKVTPILTLRC